MSQPEGRRWNTRYSLGAVNYCNGCDERSYVPLPQWMAENFYSKHQVRTLLKNGHLFCKRHKGRYYVKVNPENPIVN